MQPVVPDFSGARVLVVGDVMLDRYWSGPVPRISPEAPVPVVRVQHNEDRPGGAANVALNLAALGARTRLIGVVGEDDPARVLREALGSAGVQADLLPARGAPTITKLRVLSRNQQLLRMDFESSFAAGAFDPQVLLAQVQQALRDADVLVLSDYAKGTLCGAQALIRAARQAGVPVIVDPKGEDYERYRGAYCITPNVAELTLVAGAARDEADLIRRAEALRARLDLQAVLLTRSEHGMSLVQAQQDVLHLPARAREVFDVTGAGDTVVAVLAACVAAGRDLAQAAHLANLAAGIVVGKLGTSTVSPAELMRAVRELHADDTGILDRDTLLARVAEARAHGETIVMTNGCFDLLHVGHVHYLEAARRLGDVLIVAVNDDESVRRLKGPGRPINPLPDRMRMLAALKPVDWVVAFSEDTPAALIEAVRPDVLVKGGDYRVEDIAGADAVLAAGGRVEVLDFVEGRSTTALIERAARSLSRS